MSTPTPVPPSPPLDRGVAAELIGHPIDPFQYPQTEEWWSHLEIRVRFRSRGESTEIGTTRRRVEDLTREDFERILAILKPGLPRHAMT